MVRFSVVVCLASLIATPLAAQDRYTIFEQGDRIVRVDRQTGAVDYCRRAGKRLTCELSPQERLAWQREIDRLSDTVAELENRINRLERDEAFAAPQESERSSLQEIDEALTMTERFMRGFFGIIGRLEDERALPGQ
jgi:hypothetical protein